MLRLIREYNGGGNLLWAADYPGAFSRGSTLEEALAKLPAEVTAYCRWSGLAPPGEAGCVLCQTERAADSLQICEADTEILFHGEALPLSETEYRALRRLVLKSAEDFQWVFEAVPDKDRPAIPARTTFYGETPRTAREMYAHTNGVTGYYIRQLGASAVEEASIVTARRLALDALEALPNLLKSEPLPGDFGELWSARKVLRRFLWHDRIHVKAMIRMACTLWGALPNPFFVYAP